MLCASLQFAKMTFVILLVYRPSFFWEPEAFFVEFPTVLEAHVIHTCPILITGDSILKLHDRIHADYIKFKAVLDSFGLVQLVTGPTHIKRETLDIVVVRLNLKTPDVHVFMPEISDHSLLEVHMPCCKPAAVPVLFKRRAWGPV